MNQKKVILNGIRDGFPIGLGYFAVSFSLGIMVGKAGLSPIIGFFTSLFVRASAGEYAGYTAIIAEATYAEILIVTLITNLRYLLMNTALSQKFHPDTPMLHRILVGFCCTDEIFGISIAYPGYLNPLYPYAATLVAGPMWACGTAMGIIAGGVLPFRLVSALSVALYGMFLAIIVPASKKDKAVLIAVLCSFLCSYLCTKLPWISTLSGGSRVIILTILIAGIAAFLKPIDLSEEENVIETETN